MLGRGETILVVEDDPDIRTVAFFMLRSLGYEVLEAAGADAALRILDQSENISLMLTDVVLAGGMSGRQLAERMAVLRPHIRVLYMSGYTENAILHHGRFSICQAIPRTPSCITAGWTQA
jgi:CheY-like chemotaxis protein